MSDHQNESTTVGHDLEVPSTDSDVECSQSICSETHSDNTTVSEMTEKSTGSGSTLHAASSNDEAMDNLLQSASSTDKKSSTAPVTTSTPIVNRSMLLPWGVHKEYSPHVISGSSVDLDIRPGEYVMRSLFANFTVLAEKKIDAVMGEPQEKPLSKTLQRGEDMQFDQLLSAFGSVAEHCLPSLLRALYSWYERQMAEVAHQEQKKSDIKQKSIIYMVAGNSTETVERSEVDIQKEKRDLAVEFIFCLVLIEVLKQLSFHPGHEDLVQYIENLAFKHFKYREGIQTNPNGSNIHMISDLYAEVIGALAQSRFMSIRTRFMNELKELKSREASPHTTQSIISLLMGMKFFRVKMVPIEEFEASFQFMQECAQYFLEVKDKDIKHALAGLFVEILVPVAAAVKNEVNVPCLKNFVEMLYSQTLDASTKSKHRLALFPLVTCLLCVSQKQFFLQNWHYFLAMCLSHLKNRDPKMCRVALESLYRLLWVYMIRIKCESNSATQSRLQSIVNSLFPKGSKAVVPRDTPLNIFVKIIQFIAQERLDFAMREIVFDLLSVGRPIKIILTPERMSIGLRAFLVVADSLQQKEGEPPMPRSVGVLPSGNTLRVRKTFLNKMLTEDTARSIGISSYFPHVRRVFVDILRALDQQYGRPLMMTNTQNVNKEPDEMITGERKPRIDLFRTCVAAVPRLIPDGMTGSELVELLSRLTVHMDEELRGLAYQSLQTLVMDFPDWRQDVLWGLTQFLAKDVLDTFPTLIDNGLKMIMTLLCAWKNALSNSVVSTNTTMRLGKDHYDSKTSTSESTTSSSKKTTLTASDTLKSESMSSVLHLVEALALVMLCNYRLTTRRVSVLILKEVKCLLKILNCSTADQPVIDVIDRCCPRVLVEKCLPLLPPAEKTAVLNASNNVDLQWVCDRNASAWNAGLTEDGCVKSGGAAYVFNALDPWSVFLFGFLERDRILTLCPGAVAHSWPIVFTRLNALYSVVDPTPLNDNRASLLRSSATLKKPPTERDAYMHLWKNYITFAFRVVPQLSNPIVRCASPDLSLSSSPDSLSMEKSSQQDTRMAPTNVSPTALYKLVVPLLRCEVSDVRDAAVFAVGNVNSEACRDLLEDLVVYLREAIDKKQENVRRRRRRDALRLHLMRALEYIAENGTFNVSSCILEKDTQSLHPTFVEYIEGARFYLENEPDKTSNGVKDLTLHFAYFIIKLIKSFSLDACRRLFKKDLRKNLFMLFSFWAGKYGLSHSNSSENNDSNGGKKNSELQFVSLQAMSALLCCGPYFDSSELLLEDSSLLQWLNSLLNSSEEKVYNLAQETVILLLESNPDVGSLLDWVVDKCYTGTWAVADGCFLALATIFSAREYPCDHYTAIINVTLMNTGCPRPTVRDTALQLLQLLDKRFFGSVGPLAESDLAEGDKGRSTLDTLLATTYSRSQVHLSGQLALLHPELTMPMFSEITYRFQSARPEVRQLLLQYLLPWLHNMELVDPNVPPPNPHSYQFYAAETGRSRKEGWGSAEATEMVLNNIFYITAKGLCMVDIVLNFFTGYPCEETRLILLDPGRVVKKYIFTYFFFDLCGVLPLLITCTVPMHSREVVIISQIRYLRCVRIITLMKFFRILLKSLQINESVIQCLELAMLTTFVIHWWSCLLFIVPIVRAQSGLSNENSWVEQASLTLYDSKKFWNKDTLLENYSSVLLLTLCHFLGAGTGHFDINDATEKILLSLVLISGFLYFIYILASIIQLFGTTNIAEYKYEELLTEVNQYMFGDSHSKEIEEVWGTLCTSWPNNMKVIIRYLIIISGMAPCELLPYTKRVVLYLARVQPVRLLDEMMIELQTVETLNCLIERTETPPFYRLTVMRKTSSHSDGTNGGSGQTDSNTRQDLSVEKGTIHTKRHSGEDPSKFLSKMNSSNMLSDFSSRIDKLRTAEDPCSSADDIQNSDENLFREKYDMPQPHPLPMPEYGGYFAPLTEYLPDSSLPISSFHRCNVGVMLLCDVVVDGIELDWTIHVPLMLHILFLGLDHTRPLVYQHCKQLLLNLLIVLAQHNDHLTVAHILLNSKTNQLELGLTTPSLPIIKHNFTESSSTIEIYFDTPANNAITEATHNANNKSKQHENNFASLPENEITSGETTVKSTSPVPPVIITPEDSPATVAVAIATSASNNSNSATKIELTTAIIIKSLIDFLSNQTNPLWNYEDITAKVWSVKSAEQIDTFLQHILKIFQYSLPNAHINERWSQTALQLGLSCSSRHYAGRSLQIYRALRVPITSRMLSDILSRLVETVAEQGEDMQGYVTELLLTLEAAVESLESDFRPLDFMKDFFKSTPNLNNKESTPHHKHPHEGNIAHSHATALINSNNIQSGHARSTSYSVSYCLRKNVSSPNENKERGRSGTTTEIEHQPGAGCNINKFSPNNLSRSRSAQSLKLLGDSATQDDKLTILSQLFWLAVSLLESDYEHEFLLAVRLLARVMHRLPLDRPDARDKVEKLQSQLRWNSFPGVHALLLKGCTHPNIYEPVAALLSQFTPLLNLVVVDPSQMIAFPMNVIALLPYMLLNYEDANEICIRSAENIAQVSIEKSKKLENLGTVMNLYSRRTFSKESFQWTKCVIKYLYDTYSHLSFNMLTFLIEVLEKGPNNLQLPILNIIHCILHYVDLASPAAQPINTDLLRVIVKYIEGVNWKEALKILKLVVTRSSSLVAPPVTSHSNWESSVNPIVHPTFNEDAAFSKKELPGRTMEFTFDMSQTPVIGRRFFNKVEDPNTSINSIVTPRRSCSLSPADVTSQTGWKRPWMSQGRVRECLVNLLTTCGQRVGLPKSPSVIFSQTSDIIERQSSMASSTEEMSAGNNDMSGGSKRDDAATEFGVFKDFDFLEYESESIEGESTDNFNWGVRRRPLSQGEEEHPSLKQLEDSLSEKTPVLTVRKRLLTEESSDDDVGSESPLDEIAVAPEFDNSTGEAGAAFPSGSLVLREHSSQMHSSARSDTSGSSAGDLGEVTPCNASPSLSGILTIRPSKNDVLENWNTFIQTNMIQTSTNTLQFFHQLQKLIQDVCTLTINVTKESCFYMLQSTASGLPTIKLISSRLHSMIDIISYRILPSHLVWFSPAALNNTRFIETLKYGMLEVQEHLETFCDKREQVVLYCNAVKTTLKIEYLSAPHSSEVHLEHYLLDLGRSLYKLYFQLLLLIEAGNKLVTTLHSALNSADLKDLTPEIVNVKSALIRCSEDNEADGGVSSPLSLTEQAEEMSLQRLIENERYLAVLAYFKGNREELLKDNGDCLLDTNFCDIQTILNLYCKKVINDKPDCYIMTNQESDLADIFGRLFQVSAAIRDLESVLKNTTISNQTGDSKI